MQDEIGEVTAFVAVGEVLIIPAFIAFFALFDDAIAAEGRDAALLPDLGIAGAVGVAAVAIAGGCVIAVALLA